MCLQAVRGRPPYVAAIPCWPRPSMARRGRSRARRSHLPVSVHLQSNAGALMVRPPVEGGASTDLPYRQRRCRISRGGRWPPMASRVCLTAAPAGQGGLCGRGGARRGPRLRGCAWRGAGLRSLGVHRCFSSGQGRAVPSPAFSRGVGLGQCAPPRRSLRRPSLCIGQGSQRKGAWAQAAGRCPTDGVRGGAGRGWPPATP